MIKCFSKVSVAICALASMLFLQLGCTFISKDNIREINLTLADAYNVAIAEALDWNSNALSLYASSIDRDMLDTRQGVNGERDAWVFCFVVENEDVVFNVEITNGNIKTEEVVSGYNEEWVFPIIDIVMDSTVAVDIATSQFGLLPSHNWAVGYHFTLSKIEDEIFVGVVGFTNGGMDRIYVNAVTGAIYEDLSPTVNSAPQKIVPPSNVITPLWSAIVGNHSVYSQDSTMYTEYNGNKGASGVTLSYGMVAVHPLDYNANGPTAVASGPCIPFGTMITISSAATLANGTSYTQFYVQDLGQLNNQNNLTRYWIDIYYGPKIGSNNTVASNYGIKKVNITWTGIMYM